MVQIHVLGFSETKARGSGLKVVDIATSYVYSGVTEGRGKYGVAIIDLER